MTFDIMRKLQSLFVTGKEKHIILQVHHDVARRLQNENKAMLDEIAARFERIVDVEAGVDFHIHDVKVLRARTRQDITSSPSGD